MTNEERAQAYREVADWLLEHGDIEPQIQVRLSKMIRDHADELELPRPAPGTVVWWHDTEGLSDPVLGQANEYGFVEMFGTSKALDRREIKWWPARIAGLMQQIVDIPPVSEWPLTATAIQMFYVDKTRRFLCPVGSIGRVITREEAARKERES